VPFKAELAAIQGRNTLLLGSWKRWQGSVPHRRTAYHHPEGNRELPSQLEPGRSQDADYRSLEEARTSIARWIDLKTEALKV
jgi:hypothetical protein